MVNRQPPEAIEATRKMLADQAKQSARRPRAISPASQNQRADATGAPPDIFANEVKRKGAKALNIEWDLLPGGATVHILRHGRAFCDRTEPQTWPLYHFWIGFTEPKPRILSCPILRRCPGCFAEWSKSLEPSAVQQQINEAAAAGRARVAANPGLAAKGPGRVDPKTGADLPPRTCRVCGCTDENCDGCIDRTGKPCHWLERDLCSACKKHRKMKLGGFEPVTLPTRKRAGDLGPVIGPGARRAKQSPGCEQLGDPPGRDLDPIISGIVPIILPNVEYGPTLPLTIVGIDPGLRNLGLFVLELRSSGLTCIHRETFKTEKKHGDNEQRLRAVAQHLRHFMAKWSPRVLGFERLSGVNTGKEMQGAKGHNKDRGPLIEVIGMIKMLALVRGIPAYAVATMSARVAVMGKGKTRGSEKKNVRDAVERLTGATGLTLDQGDAGAIAFGAYCKHRDALNPPARKGVRKPRSKGAHVSRLAAQPARSRKAARKGGGI